MSFTETLESSDRRPRSQQRQALLLSPSKRRRLQPGASSQTHDTPTQSASEDQQPSNPNAIYSWVQTRETRTDAWPACFIKDVMGMRRDGTEGNEFFWLGRIPCRHVVLVGLLVGVTVYEKRTMYTVDDGTAVIECFHKHPLQPQTKTKVKTALSLGKPSGSVATGNLPAIPEIELPPPVGEVGSHVRLAGRVVKWHDTKQIMVDSIELCRSCNDETQHWMTVVDLHRTYYSTSLGPFVIPPTGSAVPSARTIFSLVRPGTAPVRPESSAQTTSVVPRTPTKARTMQPPGTSASTAYTSSSEYSPSKSSAAGSPSRRSRGPGKLPHPTRVHKHDLTVTTFYRYIKHYMDNVPPMSAYDSETSRADFDAPTTPTKAGKGRAVDFIDLTTPKASEKRVADVSWPTAADKTPRPTRPSQAQTMFAPDTSGFTLSHLRRVPELDLLARRVLHAESRRREKAEKERLAAAAKGKNPAAAPATQPAHKRKERPAQKMKRLFQYAIRQLHEQGAIVLWDGPTRPLATAWNRPPGSDARLWGRPSKSASVSQNASVSQATSGLQASSVSQVAPDTTFASGPASPTRSESTFSTEGSASMWSAYSLSAVSTANFGARSQDGDDEGALSEPSPDEEAYVSLSPAVLAGPVEAAILALMSSRSLVALVPSPTAKDVTGWLQRTDGRWARVGEASVDETLKWMAKEGKAWEVGGNRWELCL